MGVICYRKCAKVCFSREDVLPLQSERENGKFSIFRGEMAEWSIAAVLKTVEVRASGGSNPSLSAKWLKDDFKIIVNRCKTYTYNDFSLCISLHSDG